MLACGTCLPLAWRIKAQKGTLERWACWEKNKRVLAQERHGREDEVSGHWWRKRSILSTALQLGSAHASFKLHQHVSTEHTHTHELWPRCPASIGHWEPKQMWFRDWIIHINSFLETHSVSTSCTHVRACVLVELINVHQALRLWSTRLDTPHTRHWGGEARLEDPCVYTQCL